MAPWRRRRGGLKASRPGVGGERRAATEPEPRLGSEEPEAGGGGGPGADPNVEEWIYRFLYNLDAIERHKAKPEKHASFGPTKVQRRTSRRATPYRRFRSPTPFSWDKPRTRSPAGPHVRPEDSELSMHKDPRIQPAVGRARPKKPPASPAARAAVPPTPIGKLAPRCDRSILQKINQYIKSSITEGKRCATQCVRKALSYALEQGFLVQADKRGRLLRVSPKLVVEDAPKARHQRPRRKRRHPSAAMLGRVRGQTIGRDCPRRRSSATAEHRRKPGGKVKSEESEKLDAAVASPTSEVKKKEEEQARKNGQGLEKHESESCFGDQALFSAQSKIHTGLSGSSRKRSSRSSSKCTRQNPSSAGVDRKSVISRDRSRSTSSSRKSRKNFDNQEK